jgi:hypothetical protein
MIVTNEKSTSAIQPYSARVVAPRSNNYICNSKDESTVATPDESDIFRSLRARKKYFFYTKYFKVYFEGIIFAGENKYYL